MVDASEPAQQLAERLLHQPIQDSEEAEFSATETGQDSGRSLLEMVVVSVFVAFHVTTLLVYSSPGDGLGARVRQMFSHYLEMDGYMSLTANATRWAMFAPDPPQGNAFVRVMVDDHSRTRDLRHDIYGRRGHPYFFYDRMVRINSQHLAAKESRQAYAAWVCREWERAHGGQPATSVRLVRFMTEIPPPDVAYAAGGHHPLLLEVNTLSEETFACGAIPHGQLPPGLRARHGLPPAPAGSFRDVEITTWRSRTLQGGSGTATVAEKR